MPSQAEQILVGTLICIDHVLYMTSFAFALFDEVVYDTGILEL